MSTDAHRCQNCEALLPNSRTFPDLCWRCTGEDDLPVGALPEDYERPQSLGDVVAEGRALTGESTRAFMQRTDPSAYQACRDAGRF